LLACFDLKIWFLPSASTAELFPRCLFFFVKFPLGQSPGSVSCDSLGRHSAWFVRRQDLCSRFSISVSGACFLHRFYFPCAPARGSSRVLGGPVFASPFFPVQRTSAPFSFKTAPASFLADCWFRFSCRARISSSRCPSWCLALRPTGSCERPPEALLRLPLISSGQDFSFRFSDW
jgi:hypothetical protein